MKSRVRFPLFSKYNFEQGFSVLAKNQFSNTLAKTSTYTYVHREVSEVSVCVFVNVSICVYVCVREGVIVSSTFIP